MENLKLLSRKLKNAGFNVEIFESGDSAAKKIIELITNKSIGLGSYLSVKSLGLPERIYENASNVFDHIPGRGDKEERDAFVD